MTENGRCSICLRKYDFSTDGNGLLTWSHPLSPCKKPETKYTYEMRKCLVCPVMFPLACDRAGRRTVFCSTACRKAHFVILHRERRARERGVA